jgi:hypothetical protein
MKEEIITLEQVFREERNEILLAIKEMITELENMDLDDPKWADLKREIFKFEMAAEYLEDRLTGKIC